MKNILWPVIAVCIWLPLSAEANEIEHVIRCESNDFSSEHCRLPIAPRNAEIKEIKMVRQHSHKPCIEGKTWEANYEGIIVSNGCRADFRVVYQTSESRYERQDRRDRAEGNRRDEDRWEKGPTFRQDPTDIVVRAFEDIVNRPPTHQELEEYRYLIRERNWSEHDVRKDLRRRY